VTEAEILEATFGANQAMHNAFQYWISITFALILTAHLARKQLALPIVVTAGLLYFACALFFLIDYIQWVGVIRNLPEIPLVDVGWPVGTVKTVYRIALFAIGTVTAEAYLVYAYATRRNGRRHRASG
jgi:uncharacterized MAPEG superfamily protein